MGVTYTIALIVRQVVPRRVALREAAERPADHPAVTDGVIQPQIPYAQQSPDTRVADLVRAGRVRVGLFPSPLFATKDPVTGELRGMGIEIARALAARLGVVVLAIEFPSAPKVVEGLKAGACDVAFLGIDPSRAAVISSAKINAKSDAVRVMAAS